jgi:LmbE family N-acetylglucosaminyl deacetylase
MLNDHKHKNNTIMKRKEFLQTGLATGALMGSSVWASAYERANQNDRNDQNDQEKLVPWGYHVDYDEVKIERAKEGKPHKGKVLMTIQPHSDDIPLSAGGLVAKLMDEGYTGYLCSVSDDARGAGKYEQNRMDNQNLAKFYGMKDSFELLMPHHQMDSIGIQDLKQRFIFLFRFLKVDTIVCMDPWGHYEENPDHYVTGRAVEAARWIAGMQDYPEHFAAGIGPYTPKERYYYSRAGQTDNLIVDIGNYIDKKVEVNLLSLAKGPAGNNGVMLRDKLAKEGKKLPILEGDDYIANFNFTKNFVFEKNKILGAKYGLKWAEGYHYMADIPWDNQVNDPSSPLQEYIRKNAIQL